MTREELMAAASASQFGLGEYAIEFIGDAHIVMYKLALQLEQVRQENDSKDIHIRSLQARIEAIEEAVKIKPAKDTDDTNKRQAELPFINPRLGPVK